MSSENIKEKSITHAKRIKKEFAKNFCTNCTSGDNPISIFMAGSPGAGKTEVSKRLLEYISSKYGFVRIDPDEFRDEFKEYGYNGKNSHLFQAPISILADAIQDRTLKDGVSYIFDSTFSDTKRSRKNIERSLKRKRTVYIFYVYQDPLKAWDFVQSRERKEGRKITKEIFISKYFKARETVNVLKGEFKNKIKLLVLINDRSGDSQFHVDITSIDKYITERYTKDQLLEYIKD